MHRKREATHKNMPAENCLLLARNLGQDGAPLLVITMIGSQVLMLNTQVGIKIKSFHPKRETEREKKVVLHSGQLMQSNAEHYAAIG